MKNEALQAQYEAKYLFTIHYYLLLSKNRLWDVSEE